jgi:DNA-binding transcriptional LysR family regulator
MQNTLSFDCAYWTVRRRRLSNAWSEGKAEFGINMIGSTEVDVTFTQVMDDPYVLACHRGHALAKKKNLKWHDLTGYPLIRIGRDNRGDRGLLGDALTKADVRLD